VLKGRYGSRGTDLVVKIKEKAAEIEKVLNDQPL